MVCAIVFSTTKVERSAVKRKTIKPLKVSKDPLFLESLYLSNSIATILIGQSRIKLKISAPIKTLYEFKAFELGFFS